MLNYIHDLLSSSASVFGFEGAGARYFVAPDNVPRVYRHPKQIGFGLNALMFALNRRINWEDIERIELTKPEYDHIVVDRKLPYDLVRMLPKNRHIDAVEYAVAMITEWIKDGVITVLGYPRLNQHHSYAVTRH